METLWSNCIWCPYMVHMVFKVAQVYQPVPGLTIWLINMNHNCQFIRVHRPLLKATWNCFWPVTMSLLGQGVQPVFCCVDSSGFMLAFVIGGNLNGVSVIQDAILHSEQIHCLIAVQWHRVLGRGNQFAWLFAIGCQCSDTITDLLVYQDVW